MGEEDERPGQRLQGPWTSPDLPPEGRLGPRMCPGGSGCPRSCRSRRRWACSRPREEHTRSWLRAEEVTGVTYSECLDDGRLHLPGQGPDVLEPVAQAWPLHRGDRSSAHLWPEKTVHIFP